MMKSIAYSGMAAAFILAGVPAAAQTVDTLKKIKDTGAVTMGVREKDAPKASMTTSFPDL